MYHENIFAKVEFFLHVRKMVTINGFLSTSKKQILESLECELSSHL